MCKLCRSDITQSRLRLNIFEASDGLRDETQDHKMLRLAKISQFVCALPFWGSFYGTGRA